MKTLKISAVLWLFGSVAMAGEGLLLSDGWVRAMPPGATMTAGYGTLHNSGKKPLELVAVDCSPQARCSLHQTVNENGLSRMRSALPLRLLPGQAKTLSPGGLHLMVMDMSQPLTEEQALKVVFVDSQGDRHPTVFNLRKP